MARWGQNRMFSRDRPPFLLKFRSSHLFITITVGTIVFTDVFLYGVVVPVLPFAIGERCGVPEDEVQHWVSVLFAVYGGMLVLGSPFCGIFADRFTSRRAPLLLGLFALAGSTLMLTLGRSIAVLVVGRVFQGLSAALSWTVALALLADSMKKEETGRALGFIGISYSLAIMIAPMLGGIVYQRSGYYAVWGLAFGIIALDILLRLLVVERKVAARWQEAANDVSDNRDQNKAADVVELQVTPTAPQTPAAEGVVAVENDSPRRKLPPMLILLQSTRILAAFWGTFVASTVLCAFDATLALFVKRVFGWDALGAGLIFLAVLLPSCLGPVLGHLCDKYGASLLSTIGFVGTIPFLVLMRLVDHYSIGQIVLLCGLLAGAGLFLSLTLASLITEFSKVCDDKEREDPSLFGPRSAYAQSYGLYNVAWGSGALIGPVWGGGVESVAGWGTMTWTLSLLAAVTVIPVAVYTDGSIYTKLRKRMER